LAWRKVKVGLEAGELSLVCRKVEIGNRNEVGANEVGKRKVGRM
jgi:hypothetical protein